MASRQLVTKDNCTLRDTYKKGKHPTLNYIPCTFLQILCEMINSTNVVGGSEDIILVK